LNDAPTDQKKFPPTFPPPLSKQLPDGGDFFSQHSLLISLKNSKENRKG
jgi:hypothetical protein